MKISTKGLSACPLQLLVLVAAAATPLPNELRHLSLRTAPSPSRATYEVPFKLPHVAHSAVGKGQNSFRVRQFQSNTEGCDSCAQLFWPGIAAVVLGACTLAGLRYQVSGCTVEECASSVGLLVLLLGNLGFSLAIIDSYQFAQALGQGATFSGMIIGLHMTGDSAGIILMWAILQHHPEIWRTLPKTLLLVASLLALVGSSGYFMVALLTSTYLNQGSGDPAVLMGGFLPSLLLVARFVGGMQHGMAHQLVQKSFANLTSREDRPAQMLRLLIANMIGIGLGPLFAVAAHSLSNVSCTSPVPRFEVVGALHFTAACVALIAVGVLYPCLTSVKGEPESADLTPHTARSREIRTTELRILVSGCIAISFCRGVAISSLESATALLLEDEFHWSRYQVGIAISLVFLCVVPVKLLHGMLGSWCSTITWVRVLMCSGLLGAFLLFESARSIVPLSIPSGGPVLLILADAILFPSLYISDGLVMGIMQQHLLPGGSFFDANYTGLWYGVFAIGIGRSVGPPLARWLITQGGQNEYAMLQVVICSTFLILFESMVQPRVAKAVS